VTQVWTVLYGSYLLLFLDLSPHVPLLPYILDEPSLILEKLFEAASLMLTLLPRVYIGCKLAAL